MNTHDPHTQLTEAFRAAIIAVLGDEYKDVNPAVRASQNPKFGDYQMNATMGLAKRLKRKPRELAQEIAEAVDISAIAEAPEVAGPGFINITLKAEAVGAALSAMESADLGVGADDDPHPVVIDMCSVNVSKQMHVGHLRSTIIGDALARVMERRGRTVLRENHLGDWGLPIAMVLHQLREAGADFESLELPALDQAYRDAQLTARADHRGLEAALRLNAGPHRLAELEEQNAGAGEMVAAAKSTLIKLQQGDEELHQQWAQLVECTLHALDEALDTLNVKMDRSCNRGESFYRDRLDGVIAAFTEAKLAREDDGAIVVPFADRDRPMLIQKSDGGYLYATTDLAAVRMRTNEVGSDEIIYVVDARQRDHFRDLFDATKLMGWDQTPDGRTARCTHIAFGSVLGPNRKPLKTRSGENVTLKSLLDEAAGRGAKEVTQRAGDPKAPTHGLPAAELDAIGRSVGIGAIKYADLSNDLVRDYVFDMDRMIAFEGATGPYLQYAHARICSIFTKAEADAEAWPAQPFIIGAEEEKQLALKLLRYGGVVTEVAETLEPHRLCSYLYELANAYSAFYQQCPVIRADDAPTRLSRLRLCALVRRVLADGLDLLGLAAPTRM